MILTRLKVWGGLLAAGVLLAGGLALFTVSQPSDGRTEAAGSRTAATGASISVHQPPPSAQRPATAAQLEAGQTGDSRRRALPSAPPAAAPAVAEASRAQAGFKSQLSNL